MTTTATPAAKAATMLSKVPEVSVAFWVTKILTTGMGETTSDFLANTITPPVAVVLGLGGLYAAMRMQLRSDRYRPWVYWAAIVMVSIVGTMVADGIHLVGIPYAVTAPVFLVGLAAVFYRWKKVEGTLSIHSITTQRRERFYWGAVLGTFALGTAAGDLLAGPFGLGFFTAGCIFTALILLPAIGHAAFKLNAIASFWTAYVLTRPVGASFADWMGVGHDRKGLALGTGPISIALFALILGMVAYLDRRENVPA